MRPVPRMMLATLLLACTGGAAFAADPGDADWPCVQRKVENLSIGVMWPHAIAEDGAELPPALEELAARLALRRVSEEEARALVAGVAADHPGFGSGDYGRLFQVTFEHIDRQRGEIIQGIGRYGRNQARLAGEIDALQAEMRALEAAEEPDFDRMDALEAEIDWRIRVFRDRDRALTYVCESPVLLEQRAYAIAQMMLAEAD